jgi:hypothetical protein
MIDVGSDATANGGHQFGDVGLVAGNLDHGNLRVGALLVERLDDPGQRLHVDGTRERGPEHDLITATLAFDQGLGALNVRAAVLRRAVSATTRSPEEHRPHQSGAAALYELAPAQAHAEG